MKTHTQDGLLLSKWGRISLEIEKDIDKLKLDLWVGRIENTDELIKNLSKLLEKTKKLNEVN